MANSRMVDGVDTAKVARARQIGKGDSGRAPVERSVFF